MQAGAVTMEKTGRKREGVRVLTRPLPGVLIMAAAAAAAAVGVGVGAPRKLEGQENAADAFNLSGKIWCLKR
jgi:hypothetical protein